MQADRIDDPAGPETTASSITSDLGYLLFDSDAHYYETPDCFSRHIEAVYADRAITAEHRADGGWSVRVGDRPYNFMDVKLDKTNPPGSMHELLRKKDGAPDLTW